jgi:hypothetical protein
MSLMILGACGQDLPETGGCPAFRCGRRCAGISTMNSSPTSSPSPSSVKPHELDAGMNSTETCNDGEALLLSWDGLDVELISDLGYWTPAYSAFAVEEEKPPPETGAIDGKSNPGGEA